MQQRMLQRARRVDGERRGGLRWAKQPDATRVL